jgi:hypothetical protein
MNGRYETSMSANPLTRNTLKIPPENMLAYVERRLDEWGHWFARGNLYGLGYPSCSIEYRLMREGMVRTQPKGQRHTPINESAEEMEKLMQELALQNQKLALALRDYYINQFSLRQQAKQAGISHTQLKVLIDLGKQWVVGRLSCICKRCDSNPCNPYSPHTNSEVTPHVG